MLEVRNKFVGRMFYVKETLGVIPEGTKLYCVSEDENTFFCVSSKDICGVHHIKLSKDLRDKLVVLR
jgi:hypothetical protein